MNVVVKFYIYHNFVRVDQNLENGREATGYIFFGLKKQTKKKKNVAGDA